MKISVEVLVSLKKKKKESCLFFGLFKLCSRSPLSVVPPWLSAPFPPLSHGRGRAVAPQVAHISSIKHVFHFRCGTLGGRCAALWP